MRALAEQLAHRGVVLPARRVEAAVVLGVVLWTVGRRLVVSRDHDAVLELLLPSHPLAKVAHLERSEEIGEARGEDGKGGGERSRRKGGATVSCKILSGCTAVPPAALCSTNVQS